MRIAITVALALVGCSSKREPEVHPLVAEAARCAKGTEITCGRPILNVHSLKASQAYYREKLGFKVDWDHGDPPNFGSVSRGDLVLFQCERCDMGPTWTMAFMENIDRYHDELVKRGAIVKMPPTDMPWGLREMQVADPDGNVIRFGSHGHDD